MKIGIGRTLVVVTVVLGTVGCGQSLAVPDSRTEAVVVEKIDGSDLERLSLSERAAQRLGIDTAPVVQGPNGAGGSAIPYSALIYDADGATWAYTNPEGLVFVRHAVTVDRIAGELAILTSGPDIGTRVVTVGVAELWGIETGVGGGR